MLSIASGRKHTLSVAQSASEVGVDSSGKVASLGSRRRNWHDCGSFAPLALICAADVREDGVPLLPLAHSHSGSRSAVCSKLTHQGLQSQIFYICVFCPATLSAVIVVPHRAMALHDSSSCKMDKPTVGPGTRSISRRAVIRAITSPPEKSVTFSDTQAVTRSVSGSEKEGRKR